MSDLKRSVSRVVLVSWAFSLIARRAQPWALALVAQYQRCPSVQSEAFSYIRSDLELCVTQKDIKVEIDDFLE